MRTFTPMQGGSSAAIAYLMTLTCQKFEVIPLSADEFTAVWGALSVIIAGGIVYLAPQGKQRRDDGGDRTDPI